MSKFVFNSCFKPQALKNGEEGQDLVEYAFVIAMIASGATAGMTGLAGALNNAFTQVVRLCPIPSPREKESSIGET